MNDQGGNNNVVPQLSGSVQNKEGKWQVTIDKFYFYKKSVEARLAELYGAQWRDFVSEVSFLGCWKRLVTVHRLSSRPLVKRPPSSPKTH